MRVLKFGGSSVADPEQIRNVIRIIRNAHTRHPALCVVVSAQAGVTDLLAGLCRELPGNESGNEAIVHELELRHLAAIRSMLPVTQHPAAMAEVMSICNELSEIARGAALVGEVTARTRDLILSFGERLSAFVVSRALLVEIGDTVCTDARRLIRTDSAFGHARVDFNATNTLVRDYFDKNPGLHVVTGFIAESGDGQTTTLGRSGSDYTAAILGAALGAEAVEIWTDVDGVMTADPRFVEEARSIAQLSYNEAMELSHFGARVIFPATMQPAMAAGIPIMVKNSFNPEHPGTLICRDSGRDSGLIKGVASLSNISLINVEGSGMVGVAGVSARMFGALSDQQISVILISQASSEHSICIAVRSEDAARATMILQQAFGQELTGGLLTSVNAESGLAIVAVVGENMRRTPGVAAKVFGPLGRNGINVKAISQGSSELNISMVVMESDLQKALRILHQSLFNDDIVRLHLYMAGTGAIGRKLLEMIERQKEYLAERKISLEICGLINSRKMIVGDKALSGSQIEQFLFDHAEKAGLGEFVDAAVRQNLENSVFVDVTAADEPVGLYHSLLANSIAIVAANKRANTQGIGLYNSLQAAARRSSTPFHYETNVGAGLPVIGVLRSLMASGDSIIRIDAVLSGTMNYLLSEYTGNQTFTDLVRYAERNHYTEPDPRDDLSGMDVARKCLILARECGWPLELEEIRLEPLMTPEAALAPDKASFYRELEGIDIEIHHRFERATAKEKRLRYVARVECGTASVSVMEVDEQHPFYGLRGTENCISLTTKYYQQYPMVIKGPGAGVDVTSAGVLADIVRIAEGLKR